MKALLQRVKSAGVSIGGQSYSSIEQGLLILLGVEKGDTETEAAWLAQKIINLRIFEDSAGKMNLTAQEIK